MMKNKPAQNLKTFFNRSTPILLLLTLIGCTTQSQSNVTDVVATPFRDLNLIRSEIPSILVETQKAAYAIPSDQSCASLNAIIHALNEVLEPDIDSAISETKLDLIERGSKSVKKAASRRLRSTAESIIPFRGWIRKLSGAERYSKQEAAAYAAGIIRRAFVKGLMVSKECT